MFVTLATVLVQHRAKRADAFIGSLDLFALVPCILFLLQKGAGGDNGVRGLIHLKAKTAQHTRVFWTYLRKTRDTIFRKQIDFAAGILLNDIDAKDILH